MGPTYWTHNMYQIHDNMHFLHEISLRMKFSNLGHDLINITSSSMDLKLVYE